MDSDRLARLAVAGPVVLLASLLAMALGAALSDVAGWLVAVLVAAVPIACAAWVLWLAGIARAAVGAVLALVVSAAVMAAIVFGLIPLVEVRGVGLSAIGVYMLMYVPPALIAIGSVVSRGRSQAPIVGWWLVWWLVAVVAVVFGERATYLLTDAFGADAIAGSIGFLGAPSVALAAYIGISAAAWVDGVWGGRLMREPRPATETAS